MPCLDYILPSLIGVIAFLLNDLLYSDLSRQTYFRKPKKEVASSKKLVPSILQETQKFKMSRNHKIVVEELDVKSKIEFPNELRASIFYGLVCMNHSKRLNKLPI